MKVLMRRLAARLQRLSPLTITVTGLCGVLALGIPARFIHSPMSFMLLQLAVVVFVGWGAGKWNALVVSGVAIATAATVQWGWRQNTWPPDWIFIWNHLMRFVVLGVAGWLAAELSRLTRHLGDLVEERTAQWKAEVEQHKATSTRLAETLERFEQVINNITEVFWLTNVPKNEMAYISPAYERVWGRKCEDLYRDPHSWLAAVHPEDREAVARRALTDQAAGTYDVEYRILQPDGAVRWIRDRAFPVRNQQGEVYRIAGIADDITERKRTREMLQTQAAVLENMAEGVAVADEQGVVLQINPAGERLWGYACNEVVGQPASMFSALPPAEAAALMGEVLAALHATGSWRGTFRNRRKDGVLVFCEAAISRLEVQGRKLMVMVEQDVTERLHAQEQLQMQARVLENMAEAVLMVDDHGTIVLTNPALDALLGYERGELAGKSMLAVSGHPPETYRERFEASLKQIRTQGSAAEEYIARRKDGGLIEVETRSSGVSVGGRFYLVVVGQDITKRKRAEEALRQSEETLRVFLDALPEPAFLLDRNGMILVSNRALAHSLGRPEGELVGQYAFGLIPPPLAETRKAMFDQVIRTRKAAHYEDTRAGRHFMNFESPVLDPVDNVTRVALFALDITERKQAESALARQEALYHTLFELSPDGILLEDASGNILDANRALCQSFGYSREELLRHNVRRLVPADGQAEMETHLATLRTGQKLEHEVWNIRKNGERCLMRLTEKPLTLPDGRQGILVVARDITKSDRAEMAKAVFLSLAAKLSSVRTPVEAARAIYASADQLWKWDAATLSLYSAESDVMESVLFCDVVDGQRREVEVVLPPGPPTTRRRRIMREGAELILRKEGSLAEPDTIRFGDVSRPSASLMYAPMRRDGQPVGVLSIQSYTPGGYSQEDLRTLQALADYCAGALERIRTEQALQQREEINRTILAMAMDGFFALDFAVDPGGMIVDVNDAYCRLIGYSREELLHMRMADLEATESPEDVVRHKVRILTAGADRFETRHRRKDGPEIQVEISVSRLAGGSERVFGFVRDITERKRAEAALRDAQLELERRVQNRTVELRTANEALRESEGKYRRLHESMTDAFVSIDIAGRMTEFNPAFQALLGYTAEELRQKTYVDLTPQKWHAFEARLVTEQVLLRGNSEVYEKEYRRKDGTIFPVELRVFLIRDANGQPSAMWAIVRDITERKLAEQALCEVNDQLERRVQERTAELQAANAALAESEERYRSLVNNLNVGVYRNTPGPHGRFIQVNPALARMYGYDSVEELQKVRVADLYQDPGDREVFVAGLLRQGAVVNHELRLKKKDGTAIYASVNATVHRAPDGEVDWIDGVLEDITQRKQAERTLAEALELNRTLISASTVGIAAYKASGQCILANEALARITGGTLQQLLQQDFRHLQSWLTGGLLAKADAALKTGQPQAIEAQIRTTFGRKLVSNARLSSFTIQDERHLLLVVTDETEATRAERQLAEALDLNQKMIAAATMGFAAFKASGECVFANAALAKAVGGSVSEVVQGNFRRLASWRKSGLLKLAEEALSENQARSGEIHSQTRFGKDVWMDCQVAPFVSNDQPHLLLMALDITQRKEAEEALKEAQRLQKAILDNLPDPVWLKDVKGRFLACNQALARVYGQPMEAIIGKTTSDFAPDEAARLTRQDRQIIRSGQSIMVDVPIRGAQGQVRWFETIKSAILNDQGEVTGMVGASREVTQRKQAEDALKMQSFILQNMAEGALLVGPDMTILFANSALETAFGYESGELIGKSVTVLNAWPETDTARFNQQVSRTAKRDGLWIGEYQNRRKDGTLFTSEARVRLLELDGQTHYVSVQQDITDRKRLERQILEISDREQARIGQDIHDGLCQHLVSLAFDANSLEQRLSAQRQPEAEIAKRLADFLDRAITESRQLSRGLFPVRLAQEGLAPALDELARAICDRFKLQCRFEGQGLVAVENSAIATHLYRIAQEAVTNAVKHSRARSVRICLRDHAGQLELRVEDNGTGFSSAAQKQSKGMGLHIMGYRARMIGGTLHLKSSRRGGAVVSCCVPRPHG
jgi:PAS domain S-box-containing protein